MSVTQPYTLIEKCRACHAPSSQLIAGLEMDPMPLAGQFCATLEESENAITMPLSWVLCEHCGLVQALEDVNDRMLFRKYNYASSTVGGLVRHFEQYASLLAEVYEEKSVRFLEIGCNDGVLIRRLPKNWTKCGVDPSDVARQSHGDDEDSEYQLTSEPFTEALVIEQQWQGKWDVISGSNCLAHISDIRDVFEGVALALRDGGEFWVEVHDLEALLAGLQWDTIYHEHKAEWSLDSLTFCLGMLGFERIHFDRTPMHGGAIRCRFKKTGKKQEIPRKWGRYIQSITSLSKAYQQRHDHPAVVKLSKSVEKGEKIVAYGAAGRANVYLNQLPTLPFDWIVDESPLRLGKYIPCVGTPIVIPKFLTDHQPAHCLVTAWNYRDDIVRKNPQFKGKWLTAFAFTEGD
jgi:SAM-dependent methyltransferase